MSSTGAVMRCVNVGRAVGLIVGGPVAFTYTRLPPGSTVYDYACAENNRNLVTSDGRTLTLDPSGEVIDKLE